MTIKNKYTEQTIIPQQRIVCTIPLTRIVKV